MRIKLTLAGLSLFLLLLCSISTVSANQAISLNISELMQAEVVFTGVIESAEAKVIKIPNKRGEILVTTYTVNVSDVLKGDVPKTFTFTQWGATRAEAARLGKPFIYGPPLYDVGKEYTLFLASESSLGLTAPIGLTQGKFLVVRDAKGKAMVVRQYGNKSLFRNLPQTKAMTKALSAGGIKADVAPSAGPMDYDNFKAVVESLKVKE